MNDQTTSSLIEAYLDRLHAAAWVLQADRRAELVEEIRTHIDEAIASAGSRDEVTVRNILDRLGPPEEIVRAAVGDMDAPSGTPSQPGQASQPVATGAPPDAAGARAIPAAGTSMPGLGIEAAAVVLLTTGCLLGLLGWLGLVFAMVSLVAGAVLLLSSTLWSATDKAIGLLPPLFTFGWIVVSGASARPWRVGPARWELADRFGWAVYDRPSWASVGLVIFALQVIVAFVLMSRARRAANAIVQSGHAE